MSDIQQNILDDVVELTEVIKDAIEKEGLDTIVELYDCYRFLRDANEEGLFFIEEHFSFDINEAIYQETESFPNPTSKWKFFSNKTLKEFNDYLLKFIRSTYSIGFKESGYYRKIFNHNMSRYSMFIPFPEYDNKLIIGKRAEFKEKQMKFKYDFESHSDNEELIYKTKHYEVKPMEKRLEFIRHFKTNIEKLIAFKLFLETYMSNKGIPNTMFKKDLLHHNEISIKFDF